MFQIAKTFDPVTVEKIKRSALISLSGFVIAVIPMLLPDILKSVKDYPMAVAFVGSFAPWVVNVVREWLAGQPNTQKEWNPPQS